MASCLTNSGSKEKQPDQPSDVNFIDISLSVYQFIPF